MGLPGSMNRKRTPVCSDQSNMALLVPSGPFHVRDVAPSWRMFFPIGEVNLWADNFAIPVGTQNAEGAKEFTDSMLEPENIAAATDFDAYAASIPASREFIDEAVVNDEGICSEEDIEARYVGNRLCSVEARDLRTRVWTGVRS